MNNREAIVIIAELIEHYSSEILKEAFRLAVKALENERPKGHWVQRIGNYYWYKQFACSECGHEIICHENTPNYCEKCGADMRGGVINE